MKRKKAFRRIFKFIEFLRNSNTEYDLSQYFTTLLQIEELEAAYRTKSDEELKLCFEKLKRQASRKSDLSQFVVQSFAIIREIVIRELNLKPFPEQLLAGLAMLDGKLVDMKTGEGKTLAALFPVCTAAMSGKGIQVLTFNDYLARRDAALATRVCNRLGLSCKFIQQNSSLEERKRAYGSDICYLTAKEFGFDYLRDGNCKDSTKKTQREFYFVLIDEADSILIDEARSPLIIAHAVASKSDKLAHISNLVRSLIPAIHLAFDEHQRNISLTEEGIKFFENELNIPDLYEHPDPNLISKIQYALEAEYLLTRDIDYIVADNQIKLIDEFTGRCAELRRWPDGLHDAVESKENMDVKRAATVIDAVSFHDLFKLIPKISGMTGTAIDSAEEFRRFYGMNVLVIPTHKTCRRIDFEDRIFCTLDKKNEAVINEICNRHALGQPVLVGALSVSESSHLAVLLERKGVPYRLLNALNDEEEAGVIRNAGRRGAVTISTNMAGRGTDILLGGGELDEKIKVEALGGLYVIGTNRHESGRIDNQLRGRAGRQGDIGSSQFFISLEDPLFEKFGFRSQIKEKLPDVDQFSDHNGEIRSSSLRKLVLHLQKVIDGENLEIKKTLSKYSGLKEKQRLHIRQQRDEVLINPAWSISFFQSNCESKLIEVEKQLDDNALPVITRAILLSCLDNAWANQLADMADLQSCIPLRALGGRQPLIEFQREASQWFVEHLQELEGKAIEIFESLEIVNGQANLEQLDLLAPGSTWTYQVDDELFDDMRDSLIRQPGLAAGLALYGGPLFLLSLWVNSRRKSK